MLSAIGFPFRTSSSVSNPNFVTTRKISSTTQRKRRNVTSTTRFPANDSEKEISLQEEGHAFKRPKNTQNEEECEDDLDRKTAEEEEERQVKHSKSWWPSHPLTKGESEMPLLRVQLQEDIETNSQNTSPQDFEAEETEQSELGEIRTTATSELSSNEERVEEEDRTPSLANLNDILFALELPIHLERDAKELVKRLGGRISPLLSLQTHFLISTQDLVKRQTHKVSRALKYKVPIVHVDFLNGCAATQQFLDWRTYSLSPADGLKVHHSLELQPEELRVSLGTQEDEEEEESEEQEEELSQHQQEEEEEEEPKARPKHWGLVRIYPWGASNAPFFPEDFIVLEKDVLNYTDLASGENKYYALELHEGKKGKNTYYRVFTHYGKTDEMDWVTAGYRDCRYLHSLEQAKTIYDLILEEKSSPQKGYKIVKLDTSNIGSGKTQQPTTTTQTAQIGRSVSDRTTLLDEEEVPDQEVLQFVENVFGEAERTLVEKLGVQITLRGIETPLGVLTLEQIERGESVLKLLADQQSLSLSDPAVKREIEKLSGEFYSLIPHNKIGGPISTPSVIQEKLELLRLMKDMLKVREQVSLIHSSSSSSSNREQGENIMKFKALRCRIRQLSGNTSESKEVLSIISRASQEFGTELEDFSIGKIFAVHRPQDHQRFTDSIFNTKMLFHGSKAGNWLGILSRGLMLPAKSTVLGVSRTDYGLLGAGLYFGDRFPTAAKYTSPTKRTGVRWVAICTVALGNIKSFTKEAPHLTEPPLNYHSCRSLRTTRYETTDFFDDEFVVYQESQQRIEYIVEFRYKDDALPSSTSPVTETSTIRRLEYQVNPHFASLAFTLEDEEETGIADLVSSLRSELKDSSWNSVLKGEFEKPYFREIAKSLRKEVFLPSKSKIFAAMNACPFTSVKVVLMGQDPYPTPGHAHGFSFSVERTIAVESIPSSLKNVFRELKEDLGADFPSPTHGNLESWAKQGVLLLNTILTVRPKQAFSHAEVGWQHFTAAIIKALIARQNPSTPIVFLLWGSRAQQLVQPLVKESKKGDRCLLSAHPSPYTAAKGFFGCRHFSSTNRFLMNTGQVPVVWALPDLNPTRSAFVVESTNSASLATSSSTPTLPSVALSEASVNTNLPRSSTPSPIACVSPFSQKPIEARVIYKSDIFEFGKGEKASCFFYVDLLDASGEIRAIAFSDNAKRFSSLLKENAVYIFTNLMVSANDKNRSYIDHPYQLTFVRTSVVKRVFPDNFAQKTRLFTSLKDVALLNSAEVINVRGVIEQVQELTSITSKKTGNSIPMRKIVLIDEEKIYKITVSFWYKDAEKDQFRPGDRLELLGAQFNIYDRSITTKHCSYRVTVTSSHNSQRHSFDRFSIPDNRRLNLLDQRPPTPSRLVPQLRSALTPSFSIVAPRPLIPSVSPPTTPFNFDITLSVLKEISKKLMMKKRSEWDDFICFLTSQKQELATQVLPLIPTRHLLEIRGTLSFENQRLLSNKVLNTAIQTELTLWRRFFLTPATRDDLEKRKKFKPILISIFKEFSEMAICRSLSDDERELTVLVPHDEVLLPRGGQEGVSSIVSKTEFLRNFDSLTCRTLCGIDWTNAVVAGGSVLGSLLSRPDRRQDDMTEGPWAKSDVDIFLVGLEGVEEAERKVRRLSEQIIDSLGEVGREVCFVRTKNALSIVPGYPYRPIQIVLRCYKAVEEVLCTFDLDCVATAFDGDNVFLLPRCLRAINSGINLIDQYLLTRPTFVLSRLLKYGQRGFGCSYIQDGGILGSKASEESKAKAIATLLDIQFQVQKTTTTKSSRAKVLQKEEQGLYDDVFIPHGPGWDHTKIVTHMKDKCKKRMEMLLKKGIINAPGEYRPYYVVGTDLEECLHPTNPTPAFLELFSFSWKTQK